MSSAYTINPLSETIPIKIMRWLRNIIKKIGLNIDPCGTPRLVLSNLDCEKKLKKDLNENVSCRLKTIKQNLEILYLSNQYTYEYNDLRY